MIIKVILDTCCQVAAPEIAMIKVVAPRMCLNVVDRAIQVTMTHYDMTHNDMKHNDYAMTHYDRT